MNYLGDFPVDHPAVCIPFGSFAAATGANAATTNFAAADVVIFKDGSATERTSANGITVTTSFNSTTGLQMIVIDLSDNSDPGFYAAGHEYQVAVGPITVDGQSITFPAATFSIERAGGALALLKTFQTPLNRNLTTSVAGTVDSTAFTPTTTQFEADDITDAQTDLYNGRVIIFTSGGLFKAAASIADYSLVGGRGHFTVTALPIAPSNNDTFTIV